MKGVFVTGTGTEVGKTCVSAALLHLLGAHGQRVAGLKPVAAGVVRDGERWVNEDVEALRRASTVALRDDQVCTYLLREPCAPHIAAAREGVTVSRDVVLAHLQAQARGADAIVVEGVGGFCVPLADGWGADDLAVDLALPVVLVVGLRLGCLNHALLTAEAVRARGLTLRGWVGNRIDPEMAHADENIDTLNRLLHQRHGAPCLGVVPWLETPTAAAAAAHLDAAAVRAML